MSAAEMTDCLCGHPERRHGDIEASCALCDCRNLRLRPESAVKRVQPTRYTLTVNFVTSQEPQTTGAEDVGVRIGWALLRELGITEAGIDDVQLVHIPRWKASQ